MCQIGLTEGDQGPRLMFQPCLTPGHRSFSEILWEQVPYSVLVSLLTEAHSGLPSQLTVAGDVSTSVTVTLSPTG